MRRKVDFGIDASLCYGNCLQEEKKNFLRSLFKNLSQIEGVAKKQIVRDIYVANVCVCCVKLHVRICVFVCVFARTGRGGVCTVLQKTNMFSFHK